MEWQQKGGTYWVRYVDVEIVGFTPGNTSSLVPAGIVSSASFVIRVGDRVRVRPSVTTPKYKWGSVTHRSVGTVFAIESNRCDATVNFPEQTRWSGLLYEMAAPWNRSFPLRRRHLHTLTVLQWPLRCNVRTSLVGVNLFH